MIKIGIRSFLIATTLTCSQNVFASDLESVPVDQVQPATVLRLVPMKSSLIPQGLKVYNTDVNLQKHTGLLEGVQQDQMFPMAYVPKDVRKLIWSFLDSKTTMNLTETCKLFRGDVLEAMKSMRAAWKLPERRTPSLLMRHLFHPITTLQLADDLAQEARLSVIDYNLFDNNIPAAVQPKSELTPMVSDFTDLIAHDDNWRLNRLLCRQVLALDPVKDFRKVCLMAGVLAKEKDLQQFVENIAQEYYREYLMRISDGKYQDIHDDEVEREKYRAQHGFSFGEDEEFIETLKKSDEIQPVLMALKLLALTGQHKASLNLLDHFGDKLRAHMDGLIKGSMGEHPQQTAWACYTDQPSALEAYIDVLRDLNQTSANGPSLHNALGLREYIPSLFPTDSELDMQVIYFACKNYFEHAGQQALTLEYENKVIDLAKPGELFQSLDASNANLTLGKIDGMLNMDPILLKEYVRIQQLMDALLTKFPAHSPEHNFVLLQKVDGILHYQDAQMYQTAGQYIAEAIEVLDPDQEEMELSLHDMGKSITKTIKKAEVYSYKASLALHEGRFEDAMLDLEHVNVFFPGLLIAMKKQESNPHMPSELIERLGEIVSDTFKEVVEYTAHNEGTIFESKTTKNFIQRIFDEAFISKYMVAYPDTVANRDLILSR
jgi:hypothetical protein